MLVCDSETVSKDEILKQFVSYVRERGACNDVVRTIDTSKLILPIDMTKVSKTDKKKKVSKQIHKGPQPIKNMLKVDNCPSTNIFGLDCEMVGVGEDGEESMLARVSIVNHKGKVVLDTFVSASEPVTDYRTQVSGVRPENLEGAEYDFNSVRKKVFDILNGKLIVGHGLDHDMETLRLFFPKHMIRDTAHYRPFARGRTTPSLKSLATRYLGLNIQSGEHSSIEDARIALKLYLRHREAWESKLKPGNKIINPNSQGNHQKEIVEDKKKRQKKNKSKKEIKSTLAEQQKSDVSEPTGSKSPANESDVKNMKMKEETGRIIGNTLEDVKRKKVKKRRKRKSNKETKPPLPEEQKGEVTVQTGSKSWWVILFDLGVLFPYGAA